MQNIPFYLVDIYLRVGNLQGRGGRGFCLVLLNIFLEISALITSYPHFLSPNIKPMVIGNRNFLFIILKLNLKYILVELKEAQTVIGNNKLLEEAKTASAGESSLLKDQIQILKKDNTEQKELYEKQIKSNEELSDEIKKFKEQSETVAAKHKETVDTLSMKIQILEKNCGAYKVKIEKDESRLSQLLTRANENLLNYKEKEKDFQKRVEILESKNIELKKTQDEIEDLKRKQFKIFADKIKLKSEVG